MATCGELATEAAVSSPTDIDDETFNSTYRDRMLNAFSMTLNSKYS